MARGEVPRSARAHLVFNEGYSGDVDLAAEAIRLTRQIVAMVDDPEVHGLLALMLLHHARRAGRTRARRPRVDHQILQAARIHEQLRSGGS